MRILRNRYVEELKLRMGNGMVKVITGIRRCGKSYLLNELFYEYLMSAGVRRDHIICVSLDELENRSLKDAEKLDSFIKERIKDDKMHYVFIDEIQEAADFVPLLNGWLKIKNLDAYVTGSNSHLLSSDIATQFRGRGDRIHVHPLSFCEYFNAANLPFDKALDEYLTYGGMPFLSNRPNEEMKANYLKELFREIYIKDIKERYRIRDEIQLNELLDIVSSSIGSLTNPSKLENAFKSMENEKISRNTIASHLSHLEDSFIIQKACRYDIKGKRYMNSLSKYYFTDLGLRNARINFRQFERTHLMENLIFNELSIRGFNVDVGIVRINEKNANGNWIEKQIETDFVANRLNDRIYIQSAYAMPEGEKKNQEIRPLLNTNDSFKKVIIVREGIRPCKDEHGISMISLEDFLLDDEIFQKI